MKLSDVSRLERHSIPEPNSGCWLWTGATVGGGYGKFGPNKIAHRVSYETYVGAIPAGMHVCHKCDTRSCINPLHLFLGTNADNVADRNRKGRQSRGESNGQARLTAADVLSLRQETGLQRDLAAKYGVSQSLVSQIRLGKWWRHVA